MPDDLFNRAKHIGLAHAREWLPDGHLEGSEWIARNPNRPGSDGSGAFRVNIDTGKWSDFSIGEGGNDVISLFAYLYNATCQSAAVARGYKNIAGGIQAEAAREILKRYDSSYFPDDNEHISVPKRDRGTDRWEGWRIVEKGLDQPPSMDGLDDWARTTWGEPVATWDFLTEKSRICMRIMRFRGKDGKKDDRPFTIWTDGKSHAWRPKALQDKYPLYNRPLFDQRPNDPVLLVEGQKSADAAHKMIGDRYICTAWYGGTKAIEKTDLAPLAGREVFFWFDADPAGRAVIAKLKDIGVFVKLVRPVRGVKQGWDIADAIDEGWSAERLIEHIEGSEEPAQDDIFLEDDAAFRFKILGYSGDHIVFYPFGSRKVIRHKASALTKGILMQLMDRDYWGDFYLKKNDGGIAWDSACNDIIRRADRMPVFDQSLVRGTGAWTDNGSIVLNTGRHIYRDGERLELYEADGDFVYERGRFVPYLAEDPLPIEQAMELRDIIGMINWERQVDADLLTGWLTLAPFGGALRWRPHVWITGSKGQGKSWVIEEIAGPVVGQEFGVMGQGTSTPAGVRSALASSSIATIMDEMESDNQKYADYIDQILKMYREAASGSGKTGATLHGTQDGEGRQWRVQSMALFASIGAGIKHGADRDRFTLISIGKRTGRSSQEQFAKLKERALLFTRGWTRAYHARTATLIREVLECVHVMIIQATEILGSRRSGDQIGTLMAGCWMSTHDTAATASEARSWLMERGIVGTTSDTDTRPDEVRLLDEIFTSSVRVSDGVHTAFPTVSTALQYWFVSSLPPQAKMKAPAIAGASPEFVKQTLEEIGIKPGLRDELPVVQIAVNHPGIRRILKDTPWAPMYDALVGRLEYASETKGPSRFAGQHYRYRELDARELMDEGLPF